jgi:hypothetical protein
MVGARSNLRPAVRPKIVKKKTNKFVRFEADLHMRMKVRSFSRGELSVHVHVHVLMKPKQPKHTYSWYVYLILACFILQTLHPCLELLFVWFLSLELTPRTWSTSYSNPGGSRTVWMVASAGTSRYVRLL